MLFAVRVEVTLVMLDLLAELLLLELPDVLLLVSIWVDLDSFRNVNASDLGLATLHLLHRVTALSDVLSV